HPGGRVGEVHGQLRSLSWTPWRPPAGTGLAPVPGRGRPATSSWPGASAAGAGMTGMSAEARCGRLHVAGGDAELSEQFRLVVVQVEAGDLAFLEFVDAGEKRVERPPGRGELARRPAERTGVRADEAALVHAAP